MGHARITSIFLAAAMFAVAGCGGSSESRSAVKRVLFTGPRFWTGDPERAWADGLLVERGRIVEVVDQGRMARVAVGARVHQLPGELAIPGLVDAHAHLLGFGLASRQAQLVGSASLEDTLSRVESFAREHPDDPWLLGRGWDQNDWPTPRWPDADQLERAAAGRPAALRRVDGHALWVNRTALTRAGIDERTADPPGGAIHRDATGRPTGILIDNAMELVTQLIPEPTDEMLDQALEQAGRALAALGLTGVHDMGMDERTWTALTRLAARGHFPLRVVAYADEQDPLRDELEQDGPQRSGRLLLAGVKIYADGALGSRGARLLAPYRDAPETRGLWITPPEQLAERIDRLAAAGLQPAIHAIGDAANRAVLDAYEKTARAHETFRELRPRLEHAQILSPSDIPRLAAVGAIASMQPAHATSDMPWAGDRVGIERLAGAYAWRSLLAAGARLAFGSDFPVESADPRSGLYAAVTRQDSRGQPPKGWSATERLTLGEAIEAFSHGAAHAAREENARGRLVPGAWCDVTVFARDLFELPPVDILTTPVSTTVVEGQIVFP
ncbi:MAG: amidohydrolase [Acidobacteriota bacterium]|nr:MAG: amidohydrolase [Acidobacteriota bacterium]